MGRVFKRGELKQVILVVLDSIGAGHGYAIMGELKDRVGGGWKPSPGAIYPALLALVEQGLVATADRDGSRVYSLTAAGETEARSASRLRCPRRRARPTPDKPPASCAAGDRRRSFPASSRSAEG